MVLPPGVSSRGVPGKACRAGRKRAEEGPMGLTTNMRRLIVRSHHGKFKSTLPNHSGDQLLLSLLGRIVSRYGLADKAYG